MTLGRIVSILVLAAIIVAVLQFTGVIHLTGGPPGAQQQAAQDDLYSKGEYAFYASKYADTVVAYDEALTKSPTDPRAAEARFRIAKSYEELKDTKKALAAYNAYLAASPTGPNATRAKERVEYLTQINGR